MIGEEEEEEEWELRAIVSRGLIAIITKKCRIP